MRAGVRARQHAGTQAEAYLAHPSHTDPEILWGVTLGAVHHPLLQQLRAACPRFPAHQAAPAVEVLVVCNITTVRLYVTCCRDKGKYVCGRRQRRNCIVAVAVVTIAAATEAAGVTTEVEAAAAAAAAAAVSVAVAAAAVLVA